jgi:sporulation protein YlmC with PRC-barrel domain
MARVNHQVGKMLRASDERVVARVERVLIDPRTRAVAALVVRRPLPLAGPRLVLFEGVAAWRAEGPRLSGRKLPSAGEIDAKLGDASDRLLDPIGLAVTAAEERRLGTVSDATFDGATGHLTSLEVSRGMVGDLTQGAVEVPGDDIVSVGPTGILVRVADATAETTMERVAGVVGRQAGKAAAKAKHAVRRAMDTWERGSDD